LDNEDTQRPARRTALIAAELRRYNVDIAALSETRLADEGSLTEVGGGYTFFWKGLHPDDRRIHGVGFAIRTSLLSQITESPVGINERLMTLRLPLIKGRYMTVVSAYAPTLVSDELTKDSFYNCLRATLQTVPPNDRLVILGDFNARVGTNHNVWAGVIGRHGLGNANSNGIRLLNLCSEFGLVITNTLFQQRNQRKATWMHPRSKHWHLIDFVITRACDVSDVLLTRAMRGAECWTDHRLVVSKLLLTIRPPVRKQKPQQRLNVRACKDTAVQEDLQERLSDALQSGTADSASTVTDAQSLTDVWSSLSSCIMQSATKSLGFSAKKHQDWFDDQRPEILSLLQEKNQAHDAALRNPNSTILRERWKELRSKAQRELRHMENSWWTQKAAEIQMLADTNDTQRFYEALKTIFGPTQHAVHPVKSKDGSKVIKDHEGILSRWAEHLRELLNCVNPTDPTLLDLIPQLPVIPQLDDPPALHEIAAAVKALKNNKAAGPDGIPAEVFKFGGHQLTRRLHQFIYRAWTTGKLPQQWKDANIVTIYKRKGDRQLCGNSRGISLLSVAGKILARVMLKRLLSQVVDIVLPESQCGFRRGRSTADMIFVARLLQEKCREQNRDLYFAFIDLTKAFDTVNRDLLWKILSKFGCPPTFLTILQEFHNGMRAKVVIGGRESDLFDVLVGVKQGCVLAPVIFNLFLVAVTLACRSDLPSDAGVPFVYRTDGNLFNLRRLKADTKVSRDRIFELQYADDAALPAHSATDLQNSLDTLSTAYRRAGLVVNAKKTEVLSSVATHDSPAPRFSVHGDVLSNVSEFTYLGSILSDSCSLDSEVEHRVKAASSAFGRLTHRVFLNRNLAIPTKIAVYKAVCVSVLLYGCEAWTLYRRHIKALEAFHFRSLQSILGVRWWHKVPHTELLKRSVTTPVEHLLLQRQLRWLGHVTRMPENRLPRRLLYGELSSGQRSVGRPKKRFSDYIKMNLLKCHIKPRDLETLVSDRAIWKATCETGLAHFVSDWLAASEDRRAARHTATTKPKFGPQCPHCGRPCASQFGLQSHMRTHRPQHSTTQQ